MTPPTATDTKPKPKSPDTKPKAGAVSPAAAKTPTTATKGDKSVNMEDPIQLADLFGDVGFDLDDSVGFEQWVQLGENIQRMLKSDRWWVGDWLAFGEDKFGEQHAAAIDIDIDPKTLANCRWVAGKIAKKNRVAELSWSHHRIAAELDGVGNITKALKVGVKEMMTTREFQSYINSLKPDDGDPDRKAKQSQVTFTVSFAVDRADHKVSATIHEDVKKFVEDALMDKKIQGRVFGSAPAS